MRIIRTTNERTKENAAADAGRVCDEKAGRCFFAVWLAMECMNGGDTGAADGHFRELLSRNADYVPAYLIYAQMLSRESRADEARTVLSTGIAAADKNGDQHARSEMESLLSELS